MLASNIGLEMIPRPCLTKSFLIYSIGVKVTTLDLDLFGGKETDFFFCFLPRNENHYSIFILRRPLEFFL